MPQKVTVVAAQVCARVPGGTGRYTVELLRALAETRPHGVRLVAATPVPCRGAQQLPAVRATLPVPYVALARLWQRGLPPVLDADVVHAPTLLVPTTSRRARLVVTVHDVVPWTHAETLTARGVAFHRVMGARAARYADLLVTPTEAVARQVRDVLSPRSRVVAVPPGAAVPQVPVDAAARRAAFGVYGDYVLFVGTAEPRKGLDVLLDAFATAPLGGLQLVVVGPPGWGDVDVAQEGRRRGLGARVVVTGRVDEATLWAMYAGAAVLALPSRAEGFGLPVLEAMAAGIPVVTSDDPALVEVGGGAATVVPVGDAARLAAVLAEVVASPERRAAMGDAGRARAAEYSWTASAHRLWDLYEGL